MSGTVFLVGGINDVGLVTGGWKRGLRAAGLPHELAHFRWQQGPAAVLTFADLWRTAHHRRKAAELADAIRSARGSGPVHVLAHSAGTAVTAYALESLRDDESITSAAFVGSGLSPRHDLTPTLARCRAGVLSVESRLDLFYLGVGTLLLGTCDRRWRPAAGLVGFRPPSDSRRYEKLHAFRWSPGSVKRGWLGGHLSVAAPRFARTVLAEWVRQAEAPGDGSGFRAKIHSSTG